LQAGNSPHGFFKTTYKKKKKDKKSVQGHHVLGEQNKKVNTSRNKKPSKGEREKAVHYTQKATEDHNWACDPCEKEHKKENLLARGRQQKKENIEKPTPQIDGNRVF